MRRLNIRHAWQIPLLATLLGFVLAGVARADADALARAQILRQQGIVLHRNGNYEAAVDLFRRSIEAHPTAEGHTYLGYSLRHLDRIEEAIAECKKAIGIDPDYGNPYNDIGSYLYDLGRLDEAVPWLRKATVAKRYCCYQYPHFNLGRVWLKKGRYDLAATAFRRALSHDPDYLPARLGLDYVQRLENPS
jgi:tetratricopeptide (TPR) repeat protein